MNADETLGVIAQMEEDILQDTLRTIAIQIWLTEDQLQQSRLAGRRDGPTGVTSMIQNWWNHTFLALASSPQAQAFFDFFVAVWILIPESKEGKK